MTAMPDDEAGELGIAPVRRAERQSDQPEDEACRRNRKALVKLEDLVVR